MPGDAELRQQLYEYEHELNRAKERVCSLEQRLAETEGALQRAEAELRTEISKKPGREAVDWRFKAVKKAFASHYHPDKVRAGGIEQLVRAEIFKEFWGELKRIEEDAR